MRLPAEDEFGIPRGAAEITSLPGSSQIAVIHGAFINANIRGKGIGETAHRQRLATLYATYCYDAAICTVDAANEAQVKILIRNGWKCALTFKSSKTGHDVCIYVTELGEI